MKMSKSIGNYIGIDEAPGVIFTKVLNVPDRAMRSYAELVTRWPQDEIDARLAAVERGDTSMRDFKHDLAHEIVSIFHGDEAAEQAARDAKQMHEGAAPSDAPVYQLGEEKSLLDVLSEAGLIRSKGEGRRLIQQGGVRLDGEAVADAGVMVAPENGNERVVQVGKRKFLRVVGK